MIYEDYDVRNLHPNDFMMLMYAVHNKFISSKIEKEYMLNEDLPEGDEAGQKDHISNFDKIEIILSKLMIHNLQEDKDGNKRPDSKTFGGKFKEPIKVLSTESSNIYTFRLSRMNDILLAQEYCKEKFAEQLRGYAHLRRSLFKVAESKKLLEDRKKAIDELIDSDPDTYEDYQRFLERYNLEYAKIIQVCLIDGTIDGNKKYTKYVTLDEKLEAFKTKITTSMWKMYGDVVKEYPFGIIEEYTFFCDKYQRNITRRFLFQLMDFLPSTKQEYGGRHSVLFD
jgi:hypothetical protein